MVVSFFPESEDKKTKEEAVFFTPRFDANGLLTAVVTHEAYGELLMVAHMNVQALSLTLETGIAHFWSRSRSSLWKKGESSGNFLSVREIRTDCDQDAVWLKVQVMGVGTACHTGARSCFYRKIRIDKGTVYMEIDSPLP
ncbi:MAG: phosphoribosyl-AMP cyclohydrolase [Candidatus Tokpelaia sp. JSC189]|nr:MAG: phosphoribosyl-AMP cyclohydrolase [Candidatus Tokpelaia sp. JSC189]